MNFDLTHWDNLAENETGGFTLYPNPATTVLKIDGQCNRIRITDPLGRPAGYYENTREIDIRHLSEGTYFVTVESGTGSTVRKLVIKR